MREAGFVQTGVVLIMILFYISLPLPSFHLLAPYLADTGELDVRTEFFKISVLRTVANVLRTATWQF